MAREDLLELKLDQTYDAGMKENLEWAFSYQYPYQADTRLYTMMSVSELKSRVRSAVTKRHGDRTGGRWMDQGTGTGGR